MTSFDAQGFVSAPDGTRLFYRVRGSGPALILNDGVGCDGWAWAHLIGPLSERFRVVHWHYRGHGRSGAPVDASAIGIGALAIDLRTLLDALDIETAVVAGHSMGTQVALELYRVAPERVRALILLCGSAGRVTQTFHGSDVLARVLPTLIELAESYRGVARALWGRVPPRLAFRVASMSGEIDGLSLSEDDFTRYIEHLSTVDPSLYLAMLRAAGEHTAEDILESIHVPTLVIAAEKDTFTPASLSAAMAERIPNAELRVLEGATHAAPAEQPRTIIEAIERFTLTLDAPQPTSTIRDR